ncbi:MAG TPA: flagellar hook-length control protein FliK [Rhizomicrobium sp.]|nr:flagellar hook-length control protein FliK [Rhizomicrobium sp.]
MRASAASQTISPADIPAPQAKVDAHKTGANKADAASPFALLMEATAKDPAKAVRKDAKESGDKSADDKPAIKQNDVKRNDTKQNDAQQNDNVTARTAPQPKPDAPAKAAKQDKDSDKSKDDAVQTGESTDDDKQVASVAQPASDQQALPPLAPAAIIVPADPALEAQTDTGIDGATPITETVAPGMPTSGMGGPQSAPMDAPAQPGEIAQTQAPPQTAPQGPAQPGDAEAEDSETIVTAAAAQTVPAEPPVAAKDTAKPVKTAAKSEAAKPEATGVESVNDTALQSAKAGDGDEAKSAKTDLAKTDLAQNGLAKPNSTDGASPKGAHNSVAGNAKADSGASDKTDTPHPDARPVESVDAAAVKPAPQSATVSNAAFAINTLAAPQAAQHSQAPIAIQHVQVTAQAAPDVPALAVEIAAKSQSGAKQFDIRLDPPELGRVEVRLSIDATGKASAHLSADQPQTLSLLQKDAPLLTRALREAGLDVSQDGLNFSLRQQAHDQNGNDGNNGRFASSRAFSLAATASIDPAAVTMAYRGLADGRVDIRV